MPLILILFIINYLLRWLWIHFLLGAIFICSIYKIICMYIYKTLQLLSEWLTDNSCTKLLCIYVRSLQMGETELSILRLKLHANKVVRGKYHVNIRSWGSFMSRGAEAQVFDFKRDWLWVRSLPSSLHSFLHSDVKTKRGVKFRHNASKIQQKIGNGMP